MPLSLHIAHGNTRRLAGRNDRRSYQLGMGMLRPLYGLDLLLEPERDQIMKPPGDTSLSPALEKTTTHRVNDNEKFVFNSIMIPIAFKARSRRAQLSAVWTFVEGKTLRRASGGGMTPSRW